MSSLIPIGDTLWFSSSVVYLTSISPGRMASSGNDCTVRMWRHLESFDDFNAPQTVDSRDIPDCLPAAIELVHTRKHEH